VWDLDEYTKKPLLRKLVTATMFCTAKAILLVPLAVAEGSPININMGIVIKDPPPARVFKKPAAVPAKRISITSSIGMEETPLLCRFRKLSI